MGQQDSSSVGDQLELALFTGVPWNGIDPRFLTRGRKVLFLRPEPPCHEVFFDPEQIMMWKLVGHQEAERPPGFSRGAPSLLRF